MNESTAFLSKTVDVQIDRPLGSRHPKHRDMVYAVNYGFIPGTKSPDGEEMDAYVLGIRRPVQSFRGRCIAVIRRIDDRDDKLIVVTDGDDYSDEEIRAATDFQERFFTSVILRQSEGKSAEVANSE